MNKKNITEKKVNFERLNESCMSFRMNHLYISDNNALFIAPSEEFCKRCFTRRYLTQVSSAPKTNKIEDKVLNLAKNLDENKNIGDSWYVIFVAAPTQIKSFELSPYEDCPECGVDKTVSRPEATALYMNLLNDDERELKLEALVNQVFSFGFVQAITVSDKVGLDNAKYDKLLGNLFHARLIYKMINADGLSANTSSMGAALDIDLARLKALMEYLERYAFFVKLCKYKTQEVDHLIIEKTLALYKKTVSDGEMAHITSQAIWGLNLLTNETNAIPLVFIYNNMQVSFINPTTNGFGAHVNFRKSLCSSVLELVERDAFVRFWHDPENAYNFEPGESIKLEIKSIISILQEALNNADIGYNFFILQSPTKLPVVLITISSNDFSKAPSLSFGCGVGFDLASAIEGAVEEIRINAINLVKGISVIDGFLSKKFTGKIESMQDRANFYATHVPRRKLKFLDAKNPLVEGVVEDAVRADLDAIVERFKEIDFDIYAIDCAPACFQDKNVVVTRAFSPQLYPLQFVQEDAFALVKGSTSSCGELPHFFL